MQNDIFLQSKAIYPWNVRVQKEDLDERGGLTNSEIEAYSKKYACLERVPDDKIFINGLINYLNQDYGVIVCNPGPPRHELLLVAGDPPSQLLYVAAWNPVGNTNAVKWVEIANLTMYIVKKYK